MMKYFLLFVVVSTVAFTSMTCHSPTQPPADAFTIELADTSCTEAWLNVHLASSFRERTVEITRDTATVMTFTLSQTDTTVSDTGLLPYKTYTYTAHLTNGTTILKSTAPLHVQTLDTTSNSFSWTTYSLGNGGATSSLYDVAIINDTLAYAVGEIHYNGTLCNLARWDGKDWQLIKIYFHTICGQSNVTPYPAKSLFAFSPTKILIAMDGDQVVWWNGHSQTDAMCLPFSFVINKLWGTDSNSVYAVGDGGNIAHYTAGIWQKIESGTTLNIQDIYGAWNAETKQYEILAVASNPFAQIDKDLLSITPTAVTQLSTDPIPYPIGSTWFIPGRHYYTAGNGIFEKHLLSDVQWNNNPLDITSYYIYRITGSDVNDVVAVGGYGECLHFNGKTWKSFYNETHSSGNYYSVAMRGNLVIAVGQTTSQGLIAIGKRNP